MKQTIIYLRTSTEEQNPENQLKDCVALLESLNLNDYEVLYDKVSGWKEKERESFDKIKKAIMKGQIRNIICWDLDRIYRNRKNLVGFFKLCKTFNCKIYSARQEWLENLNKIQEPFNEIMYELMLQILGWLAEEESNKKSERTKNAVRKIAGVTKSYKGNKWGRKPLSKNTIKQVLELHNQGLSMREISKQVYYWDKNNNKKQIALSSVHKIIMQENSS